MRKLIPILLFLLIATAGFGQSTETTKAIKASIATLFKGLQSGDSSIVSAVLHPSIHIQTTGNTKEGAPFLKAETKAQFLQSIANKKPSDTYLEKLLSFSIRVDGNLASVWTPYEFYYNGAFSHCGANSFQLYNNNGNWQIIYIVDMRRRAGCHPSKK